MNEKDFKKMWSNFLIDIDKNMTEIAQGEGITKQSMGRKINNASIRYLDLANIVEKYGYSVEIHKKN